MLQLPGSEGSATPQLVVALSGGKLSSSPDIVIDGIIPACYQSSALATYDFDVIIRYKTSVGPMQNLHPSCC